MSFTAYVRKNWPPTTWMAVAGASDVIDCNIAFRKWYEKNGRLDDEWVVLEDPETPQPRPKQ